jgi:hypothetical protein
VKLRTLLLAVILVPAVLYGLAKVYVHYRVTSGLDRLVSEASPFMDVKYGDVETSLFGKLTIEEIEANHAGSTFFVNVDTVELQGDGFGFLLDLAGGLDKKEVPPELSAQFTGIEFPINDEIFSSLMMMGDPNSGGMKKVCTLGGLLQRSELMELGYKNVNADVGFGYEYRPHAKTLEARIDYEMLGVESIAMNIRMSELPEDSAAAMVSPPVVEDANIVYSVDPEYMQRAIRYCANKEKQEPEAFIKSLFSQGDIYYQYDLGFVPGHGIRSLFEELLTKGGTVEVKINVPSDMPMQQMAMIPPERLVGMLIKQVNINGRLITDLSLSRIDITGMEFAGEEFLDEDAVRWAEEQRSKRRRWSYQEVSKKDLASHLGRQVKLYVKDSSKPRVGELDEVRSNEVLVDLRKNKGTITSHVPFSQLLKAEVYLPEPPKVPAQ